MTTSEGQAAGKHLTEFGAPWDPSSPLGTRQTLDSRREFARGETSFSKRRPQRRRGHCSCPTLLWGQKRCPCDRAAHAGLAGTKTAHSVGGGRVPRKAEGPAEPAPGRRGEGSA